MIRQWGLICGVVVAALLGAGAAGAADTKPWRYGVLDAKSDAGFSFMITRGFAEKQGLKLEIFQFPADTQLLQALVSGEVDSFEGGPGNDIMAATRGADVKVIGCTWPGLPHVIFARSTVGAVQDLKGKSVASGPPAALPDLLLRILLDKTGIPVGEVRFNNLGNDQDRYKALVAEIVDAAVVSNEMTPIAEPAGFKMIAAASDFAPNFPRLCIQSTAKTLAARHDDAVRFMAAEIASLRFAVAHRDETLKLTREMNSAKPDDPRPAFIFDWAIKTGALDPDVAVATDKLKYIQDMLVTTGHITKPIDINTMIDTSVRQAALALLAK